LEGLLGADLIGFHIQSHCTSFLQTVDRTLESRIDWEHFAVVSAALPGLLVSCVMLCW